MALRFVIWSHILLCLLGILVSLFAFYVEKAKETNADYHAVCDISETVSCSAVFSSRSACVINLPAALEEICAAVVRYGKGFGLIDYFVEESHWFNQPNSVIGILFYLIQLSLGLSRSTGLLLCLTLLSVIANSGSIYLAYILVYILHDLCIVCVIIYIINALLLVFNLVMWRHLVNGSKVNSDKLKSS